MLPHATYCLKPNKICMLYSLHRLPILTRVCLGRLCFRFHFGLMGVVVEIVFAFSSRTLYPNQPLGVASMYPICPLQFVHAPCLVWCTFS